MDELEQLRRRKMMQMHMMQQQKEAEDEQKLQQQIQQLDGFVKQHLTREALVRYGTIKTAHAELALQVMVLIHQFVQQNKVNQITDAQLKELLQHLNPKKREMIIRKV